MYPVDLIEEILYELEHSLLEILPEGPYQIGVPGITAYTSKLGYIEYRKLIMEKTLIHNYGVYN